MLTQSEKNLGERIYLEVLDAGSISDNYVKWMNDREVKRFLAGSGEEYTLSRLQCFVKEMNESGNNFLYGIFLKESQTHIGNIKVGNIHEKNKNGDLGLLIGEKEYWGQGYATEAIKLVTQYAFKEKKLNKLFATILDSNTNSYRAFIKAGYREVGRMKKHTIFEGKYVDTIIVEKCRDE